ncbi:hypothetical protein TSOC_004632 [Tetrabaena socialis]|uniref:SAP domain-containing protein n=1 Tax=Tetrabaena socialis TaxID=47790 RepID=A0A2J8A8J7_9CHLO|nr:hypothetical protein TSOC_004632 [Tetrabaena socialis]|eukprot:PNH08783.1 hypothetical protein TSOC_004632 [Tetrabaena socialis]
MKAAEVPSLKVTELKDELKKRRLSTTGTKAVLAERLLSSIKEDQGESAEDGDTAADDGGASEGPKDEGPKDGGPAAEPAAAGNEEATAAAAADAGAASTGPPSAKEPVVVAEVKPQSEQPSTEPAAAEGPTAAEAKPQASTGAPAVEEQMVAEAKPLSEGAAKPEQAQAHEEVQEEQVRTELLVVADGKLDVARHDAVLLVVAGSVAGQLQHLGSQVLEHGGQASIP